MAQPPTSDAMMERLRAVDRAIILAFARQLRGWQGEQRRPVHTFTFAAITLAHGLANIALCFLSEQPEWLWAVALAATGAVAFYLLDNEPLLPADEGIALTQFGCEDRWMLWRLAYLGIAAVGLVGLCFDPTLPMATVLVFLVEILALAAMEYLLCFRLVDPASDDTFGALLNALKDAFAAANEADRAGVDGPVGETDDPAAAD